MIIYRVKQFWWALTSNFKPIDDEYINEYLNDQEREIFNKLKKADKHHSIRVSKDSLEIYDEVVIDVDLDKSELARAALLHDIGKAENPLNFIEKSFVVILDRVTKGKVRKYSKIKMFDTYYNHPKKGVDILYGYGGYNEEFLQVIGKHHEKKKTDNIMLSIVVESDNKN